MIEDFLKEKKFGENRGCDSERLMSVNKNICCDIKKLWHDVDNIDSWMAYVFIVFLRNEPHELRLLKRT